MFDLEFLEKSTGGKVIQGSRKTFEGIGTDTREGLNGKLFLPLKGENFDGHDYIEAAIEKGIAGFITHRKLTPGLENFKGTIVQVKDTLVALQRMANYHRKKWGGSVISITGSNGKTSTKAFTHQILRQFQPSHSSQGSYNNHWGVPFTLLDTAFECKSSVVEMGMNHVGEITELCKIAEPDIVGVLNVGRAHVGNFPDMQTLAGAKAEIYKSRSLKGQIFNLDNEYTLEMYKQRDKRIPTATFSTLNPDADVYLKGEWAVEGIKVSGHINGVKGSRTVPVWGMHNVSNIGFAVTAAKFMGIGGKDLWCSLDKLKGTWGRGQWISLREGGKALFDAYNANPDSFSMLVENLASYVKHTDYKLIGVFGEMLELGAQTYRLHYEMARELAQLPFEQITFVGESTEAVKRGLDSMGYTKSLIISSTYKETLASHVDNMLSPKSLVIIKGSRSIRLERFLGKLGAVL